MNSKIYDKTGNQYLTFCTDKSYLKQNINGRKWYKLKDYMRLNHRTRNQVYLMMKKKELNGLTFKGKYYVMEVEEN
jgi:hypothetical protein